MPEVRLQKVLARAGVCSRRKAESLIAAGRVTVNDETVWQLGAYYVPTILALWMTMIAIISGYKLDRAAHEENLRKLLAQSGG